MKEEKTRKKKKKALTFCPYTLPTVLDFLDIFAQMLPIQIKLPTHISHLLQSKPDVYRTDHIKRK